MFRSWLVLALCWALLVSGGSEARGEPAPARGPLALERLERVVRSEGIEVGFWRYGGDGTAGRMVIASIDPARARIGVLPAAAPAPLASLPLPDGDHVAINGGFYDRDQRPMGLVMRGGREHARLRRGGGSGVFFVGPQGPGIAHRSADLLRLPLREALQSIDRLVDEGVPLVNQRPGLQHDARSAVAIDWRGIVHLVVAVDERSIAVEGKAGLLLGPESTSTGPTLWQLAELLARPTIAGGLGARWALNLDGGFSTAMQIRLGGQRYGIAGYRGTINAIYAVPGR